MRMRTVLVIAVTTALLAYYFHSPLPENMTDQWKLKIIIAGYRISNLMASYGDKLGYDTSLNITRQVFGSMFAMTSHPVSDHGLVITNTVMDGVRTRVYRPDDVTKDQLLPVVMYYHGGGFIVFSIDTYENVLRQIAKDVRAVVVAVEYRLAPENPFPVPVDDCVNVTRHVLRHASDYHGDATRVALAGDSAGGQLTASVALRLAETPEVYQPKLQVLLYPMLQAFDFKLPSYVVMNDVTHEIVSGPPLAGAWYMYCTGKAPTPSVVLGIMANKHTSTALKQSKLARYVSMDLLDKSLVLKSPQQPQSLVYDQDLASELERCISDPFFSPLFAPDFSNFPTSYVMTSEYDVLRDEGLLFVSRLKEAGVTFFHNHKQTGWHGISSYTRTESGRQALNEVIQFLINNL